jgi:hypothetical protein
VDIPQNAKVQSIQYTASNHRTYLQGQVEDDAMKSTSDIGLLTNSGDSHNAAVVIFQTEREAVKS